MRRSSRIERDGEYTKMPAWLVEQSSRDKCEVCGEEYGKINGKFILTRQVIDHIFAVRFLLKLGLNPHLSINTLSCCGSCHGRKLNYETLIFAGDVLGFMQGLAIIHYPAERVVAAASFYGFRLPMAEDAVSSEWT